MPRDSEWNSLGDDVVADLIAASRGQHSSSNGNGSNGHIPELTKAQLAKVVPPKLRGKAKNPGEGDRSIYQFGLAKDLLRAGVPEKKVEAILKAVPSNKFRGRNDEDLRLRETVERAKAELASEPKPNKRKREKPEPDEVKLVTISADQIEIKKTEWLWKKRIPLHALSVVAGRQGNGKSQWTCWLTARVTRGKFGRPPANVLIASLEDDMERTIAPRLKAAGADMKRVRIVDHVTRDGERDVLRLPQDADVIAAEARRYKAELIVVDPLSAALSTGSSFDSHRESDVRLALTPLQTMAREQGLTFLAVMHVKKKDEEDAMLGVTGSIAYTAVPRAVLVLGYDPTEGARDDSRILALVKHNLGPEMDPLEFRVRPMKLGDVETSRVVFADVARIDMDEMSNRPRGGERKLEPACRWLDETLRGKTLPTRKILQLADEAGISEATLKRAKKRLGVEATNARGPGTQATWSLGVLSQSYSRAGAREKT